MNNDNMSNLHYISSNVLKFKSLQIKESQFYNRFVLDDCCKRIDNLFHDNSDAFLYREIHCC